MPEAKRKETVRDDIERALKEQEYDVTSPAQRRLRELEDAEWLDQVARVVTGGVVGGALLGASRRARRLLGRSRWEESPLATLGATYTGATAGAISGDSPVFLAKQRRKAKMQAREREARRKKK